MEIGKNLPALTIASEIELLYKLKAKTSERLQISSFTAALKANAVSLVLSHNHPSGNLRPSKADEDLPSKIKNAGIFLDIKVLDHIIISSEVYLSFADEGLL